MSTEQLLIGGMIAVSGALTYIFGLLVSSVKDLKDRAVACEKRDQMLLTRVSYLEAAVIVCNVPDCQTREHLHKLQTASQRAQDTPKT